MARPIEVAVSRLHPGHLVAGVESFGEADPEVGVEVGRGVVLVNDVDLHLGGGHGPVQSGYGHDVYDDLGALLLPVDYRGRPHLTRGPVHVKEAPVTPPGAAPAVGDVELHLLLAVCPAPLKLDSANGRAHRGVLSNAAAVQVLGKRFDFP